MAFCIFNAVNQTSCEVAEIYKFWQHIIRHLSKNKPWHGFQRFRKVWQMFWQVSGTRKRKLPMSYCVKNTVQAFNERKPWKKVFMKNKMIKTSLISVNISPINQISLCIARHPFCHEFLTNSFRLQRQTSCLSRILHKMCAKRTRGYFETIPLLAAVQVFVARLEFSRVLNFPRRCIRRSGKF